MSRLLIVTSGLAILGILAALVWPAMGGLTLLLFVLSLLVTLAIFLFLFLLWTLRRFGWIRLAPRFPRVVLAVLLVTLAMALAAQIPLGPAVPVSPSSVSEEITFMARTDQENRWAARIAVMARDHQRIERVVTLVNQDLSLTSEDKFRAALILLHGWDSDHFQRAYALATAAKGVTGADHLADCAEDRYLLSVGKPAIHGTQFQIRLGGK